MASALSSAAEGVNLLATTGAPVGYQPSVRYWRARTTAPVPVGLAMDVPESGPYVFPACAETTDEAGARNVGLMRPSAVGPRLVVE